MTRLSGFFIYPVRASEGSVIKSDVCRNYHAKIVRTGAKASPSCGRCSYVSYHVRSANHLYVRGLKISPRVGLREYFSPQGQPIGN